MARPRVSRLQKHVLRLLMAEYHRTHGGTSMGHLELVKALAGDKSNISHSLRTLETRGWIVIGRTRGAGQSISISRQKGSKKPQKVQSSCD
jgi:hypothetical protein